MTSRQNIIDDHNVWATYSHLPSVMKTEEGRKACVDDKGNITKSVICTIHGRFFLCNHTLCVYHWYQYPDPSLEIHNGSMLNDKSCPCKSTHADNNVWMDKSICPKHRHYQTMTTTITQGMRWHLLFSIYYLHGKLWKRNNLCDTRSSKVQNKSRTSTWLCNIYYMKGNIAIFCRNQIMNTDLSIFYRNYICISKKYVQNTNVY